MKIFKAIKRYLTRNNWEIVWTEPGYGWNTIFGFRVSRTKMINVLQIDRNKKTYRAFATNGMNKIKINIMDLVNLDFNIEKILKDNGIKI